MLFGRKLAPLDWIVSGEEEEERQEGRSYFLKKEVGSWEDGSSDESSKN